MCIQPISSILIFWANNWTDWPSHLTLLMRIWILIHKQFESRLLERILIWILIRILILKKFECRVLEEGEDVSKCNVMVGGYELKTSIKGKLWKISLYQSQSIQYWYFKKKIILISMSIFLKLLLWTTKTDIIYICILDICHEVANTNIKIMKIRVNWVGQSTKVKEFYICTYGGSWVHSTCKVCRARLPLYISFTVLCREPKRVHQYPKLDIIKDL